MEMNILKASKEEIEVQLDNVTLAEILRVYLNKDSNVVFAAWRRNHPTEKPVLKIRTKGKTVKKAIEDAVEEVIKELDRVDESFKKLK